LLQQPGKISQKGSPPQHLLAAGSINLTRAVFFFFAGSSDFTSGLRPLAENRPWQLLI